MMADAETIIRRVCNGSRRGSGEEEKKRIIHLPTLGGSITIARMDKIASEYGVPMERRREEGLNTTA